MRGGDQQMYLRAALPVQTWLSAHARALWLPLGAAFVLTHALWCWQVTQSPVAAILGALSVLTIRQSLGGDYWGFDGPNAVGPRTLQAILVPLALMLPGWWALLALVHPGTVWTLAARLPTPRRALGYAWERTSPEQWGQSPSVARAAILWRFAYLFYPIERRTLISVLGHLLLPFTVWAWVGAPTTWFVVAALSSSLGITALIQVHSYFTNRPPLDIQWLRQFRLLYPVFGLGFALAYAQGHYWLLPLALWPPRWVANLLKGCLGIDDPAPHQPGRDDVEGRWFKDGALAYLAGPSAMVAWYGRKP